MSVRSLPLAFVVAAAACAGLARRPAPAVPETAVFGGAVAFRAAPGWTPEPRSFWGDDAVVLSSGTRSFARFHLRQGDPQKDELVLALKNPPWDSPSSLPAYEDGALRVDGREVALWRRSSGGVRQEPGEAPTYFTDEFCVVPLPKGFLLAVFESEDHSAPPSPSALAERQSGWRAMLESLRFPR